MLLRLFASSSHLSSLFIRHPEILDTLVRSDLARIRRTAAYLRDELAGRVRVGKLNVDENPATASRFGIRSIPTLLILRDGSEVGRIVGAVPREEIVRRLGGVL